MARYSIIDPAGVELSASIPEEAFEAPIILDPVTHEPTSYAASGHTLGFTDDNNRTPHSDESVAAIERGSAVRAASAAERGLPTIYGPVEAPAAPLMEPSEPEKEVAPS